MNAAVVVLFTLASFALGYRFYARFLGRRLFAIDEDLVTPAHEFEDGRDFVPTKPHVLLGHHYTSIAGAAPIVGPAIAVIWGWVPALLWVVLGTVFIGAVHDFGALVISVKHQGRSVGDVAATIISPHARLLFLAVIFFLIWIVLAVFALVIATLFINYPSTVLPINAEIILAIGMGFFIYRTRQSVVVPTLLVTGALYFMIWIGTRLPLSIPQFQLLGYTVTPLTAWVTILMGYCFIASVLPVWMLLQPRDFINAYKLVIGLGLIFTGIFVSRPLIVAPAIAVNPPGAPPWMPFLFVTIACGAISGFHGLVSSGTTSKQLDRLQDARVIGYGGMLGEGCLALASVMAATAGFATRGAWLHHYESWGAASGLGAKVGAFVNGSATFLAALGIPTEMGVTIMGVLVISFAATSLDTATRIQRYIISELGDAYKIPGFNNRYLAAGIAVVSALVLALGKGGGQGGLILWPVFGATNQMIGAVTLLVLTVYVWKAGRPAVYLLIPMVYLSLVTMGSMMLNLGSYFRTGNYLLMGVAGAVLLLDLLIIREGVVTYRKVRTSP